MGQSIVFIDQGAMLAPTTIGSVGSSSPWGERLPLFIFAPITRLKILACNKYTSQQSLSELVVSISESVNWKTRPGALIISYHLLSQTQ